MNSQPEISAKAFINQTIRILYVEGNSQDAEQTRSHFAEVAPKFTVDVVNNCAEALACLSQPALYDLALIDQQIPGQSRLDFVSEVKRLGLGLPAFIIILDEDGEESADAALKLGAADYIVKGKGYLNQLTYCAIRAFANAQLSRLNEQFHCDGVERRQIKDRVGTHQLELEMQNDELRRAQIEMDALQARYVDLCDSAPVGYCTVNLDGVIEQANLAALGLLGMPRGGLFKQPLHRFIFKEDWGVFNLLCNQISGSAEPKACDLRMVKNDGTQFWVLLTAAANNTVGDEPVLRIVLTDVTELKQAEEKLHLSASVFSYAREGIMITAVDGVIIEVNDAFCDITGYTRDEVLGRNPRLLSSGRQEIKFYTDMWRDLIDQGHWYGEVWNRRKNGEVFAVMQTISAVRDDQGTIGHYVSMFFDITALKEHEQKLECRTHYDALTGLPNRVLLADRLQQSMAQTRRRGRLLAVAFLDFDGFKDINDDHGHEVGDQLLIAVANCIKQTLREGDTLARLGGDEFVAVLPDLDDSEASMPMLSRLLAAAAEPIHLGEYTLQVSASIGVAFYPQEAEDIDADQLLRQADQAMYQAKQAGKNRYHLFDAGLDSNICGRYESLEQIRHALIADEFVLYYQPKVNMRNGEVVGAEALIRWQHPKKGLLPPTEFLPVIEDHSLAIDVGEWVINTALAQMEIWQSAGLAIPVSVNVCARQLQHKDFIENMRKMLAAHPNIKLGNLELELLETTAMKDLTQVSRVIDACRKMGVSFALDDFGTGYSSLTYLKQLTVTTIKIDQTFVRGMLNNLDDLSILKGVLGLSASFNRKVIAEGVETIEHGAMLLRLGCDLGQGFGIAHPMPAQEFPGWSVAWQPDPSWANIIQEPELNHLSTPYPILMGEGVR